MATYTRNNAWSNGGTFDNPDLLWYAKGVGAMQARALNDTSSWWFFGAIHGEYVTPASTRNPRVFPWSAIPAPPAVPTSPLPAQSVINQYWDQCQHQSWYFPPWHRGYLIALEAQIRAIVIGLGGPSTWALPYWDYFGPGQEYSIPPAFTQPKLPDGSPNPLYVAARFGPDSDGKIYVPTPAGEQAHPNDRNFGAGTVTSDCMTNDLYTGSDSKTDPPGFGGPVTRFSHGGSTSGNLENNPHNMVHSYVGNQSRDGRIPGLMSDPGMAALDPIFYLHHANIDRMWAAWNANPANVNPTISKWLNGPTGHGDRAFVMPMPDGTAWTYTPQQMENLNTLNYVYSSLPNQAPPVNALAARLVQLGANAVVADRKSPVTADSNMELVGASQAPLQVKGSGARTTVKLDPDVRQKVSDSLTTAATTGAPDRVYLHLDGVRGNRDHYVLSVYINLPEGTKPGEHKELLAGSVGLFGLSGASWVDGEHGGAGLNFVLNITPIVDALHLQNALASNSIDVTISPQQAIRDDADISIDRVSIYRHAQ